MKILGTIQKKELVNSMFCLEVLFVYLVIDMLYKLTVVKTTQVTKRCGEAVLQGVGLKLYCKGIQVEQREGNNNIPHAESCLCSTLEVDIIIGTQHTN